MHGGDRRAICTKCGSAHSTPKVGICTLSGAQGVRGLVADRLRRDATHLAVAVALGLTGLTVGVGNSGR